MNARVLAAPSHRPRRHAVRVPATAGHRPRSLDADREPAATHPRGGPTAARSGHGHTGRWRISELIDNKKKVNKRKLEEL